MTSALCCWNIPCSERWRKRDSSRRWRLWKGIMTINQYKARNSMMLSRVAILLEDPRNSGYTSKKMIQPRGTEQRNDGVLNPSKSRRSFKVQASLIVPSRDVEAENPPPQFPCSSGLDLLHATQPASRPALPYLPNRLFSLLLGNPNHSEPRCLPRSPCPAESSP